MYDITVKTQAMSLCNQIPAKYTDANFTEFAKKYSSSLMFALLLDLKEVDNWMFAFETPEDEYEAKVHEVLRMILIAKLHAVDLK